MEQPPNGGRMEVKQDILITYSGSYRRRHDCELVQMKKELNQVVTLGKTKSTPLNIKWVYF